MVRGIHKYRFNYSFILFWFIFVTLNFLFFLTPNSSALTQVTLEWSPNSEPDLAGYRVYSREEGQSYDYANSSWEGVEISCTIYDLDETKTYYFVVRAFDTDGFESGNSNEVCLEDTLPGNTAEVRVATGSDDAEEYASGGMYLTSSDLEMVYDNNGDQTVGMRFNGVNIPQGATIVNAYIQFQVDETSSGATSLTIEGEDIDNAQTFDSSDLNISSRSRTNAYVSWSPPAWETVGEAGFGQRTPDISSIIQDIVNRSGWLSGNSLVVIISGTGERVAESYNGDQNGAPLLHVEYSTDTTTDNEPPTANAGPDQTADEGQVVTLNGSNSTDLDDGIASYHWVQTGGPQVTLSDPNGPHTTFTAPDVGTEGASLTFELTVVDHSGVQNTDSCVVNVTWLNEPPEANAGFDQTVDEGGVVTLDGSSSLDIDGGIAAYLWTQTSGPLVTLSDPASSQPTLTAPNVGPEGVSLTFILTVTDASGLQDTDSCIVNITWQNEPPTAVVAEEYIEAEQGTTVTLDGSGSTDADDGITSYLWTQVDGVPVTLSDPTSNVTTFTAPETDPYGSNLTFQLTVTDFGGLQSTANCSVYVTQPPAADAGPDQTADGSQLVTLNSSNSTDPDGEIVSYQWNQISGTPVTLSDPTSAQPTFTAPDVGPDGDILTFSLTVTDNHGLQETDICTVTVNPSSGGVQPGQVTLEWNPNNEPDLAGYRVYSREEGQSYDYFNPSWEGMDTSCTIYNLDEIKTYYFVVRAFDTEGFESGDSNEVRLDPATTPANEPPIAHAGPDHTVDEGQLVTLDGSNSTDPDDGIASYHWVQTGGSTVTLSDSNAQRPTFTAPNVDADGSSLIFELTVADHSGVQNTDSCVVTVTWLNEPPEANAGTDQTVDEGVVVTLDGSSSLDIDDGIAAYLWTQTSGPAVTLSSPTSSQPTFTAPDVGSEGASLNFNLVVTDFGGLQDTDSCIVNITWQNEPPTAVVAEEYIEADQGTTVTLDGSGSTDADDGITSYLWTQVDGVPVTLSDPTSSVTTFTAPETDPYGSNLTFQLTVTDFGGLQSTANCLVYVTSEINEPPIANAGENQVVYEDDVIILDGSRSSDPDGEIASYQWTQISGPTVTLSDPRSALPTFVAPDVGPDGDIMTFSLTVTDNGGLQGTDTCSITVNPSQSDVVTITSATYISKPKKLSINAVSNAPAGSITLTAWANYGTQSVKLGNLKYSAKKKVYSQTFRRINSAPDTVTVTSSGGGSDTAQCIIE